MQETPGKRLPQRLIDVITDWQRRLLQLDRRNNLLYFKTGSSAVRITERTPDDLLQAMLSSRNGLAFDYVEPRPRKNPLGTRPRKALGEAEEYENQATPRLIPGDLKGDCPVEELQRRLSILRRRDREWEDEQGLNVLFLAIGFLEWVDDEGQRAKAPLLLLPCDLKRESPRSPFVLVQDDEDLTTNGTLAVKLKELGVELPESDSGIETASEYLHTVKKLIANHPVWRVTEEIYMATFAYSKLAMWRDLETVKTVGTSHPIVTVLAGGERPPSSDLAQNSILSSLPQDLRGGRLDDCLEVRDQYAVLPADYSQMLAITRARSGCNLLVHGPPGTGKSQTIANIIATFLAEAKTVLFVSEKTAALDVVKRRLDEKELGTFCLDLHSDRGKKANVYRQLQEAAESRRTVRELRFDYATLSQRRQELNEVVRALHKERSPFDQTVFQVHGRFASLREVPHVGFDVADVETLEQNRLASILAAARRVAIRQREFREHSTSRWHALRNETASLRLSDSIRSDMHALASGADEIRSSLTAAAVALGVPGVSKLGQAATLEAIARHLSSAPSIPLAWLEDTTRSLLKDRALVEMDLQTTRATLLNEVHSAFGDSILSLDLDAVREELVVTEDEERLLHRALGDQWSTCLVEGPATVSSRLRELADELVHLNRATKEVAEFLGLPVPDRWTSFGHLLRVAQTVGNIGPVPAKWVMPRSTKAILAILEEARELVRELDQKENRLFARFEAQLLEAIDSKTLIRYRTAHRSRMRRLIRSDYRSDRKAIQAFHRNAVKLSFEEELKVVEEVVALKGLLGDWENVAVQLETLLQDRFAARSTEWDSVCGDLRDCETLLEGYVGNISRCQVLLTDIECVRACRRLSQELERGIEKVRMLMSSGLGVALVEGVEQGTVSLTTFQDLLAESAIAAKRIEAAAAPGLSCAVRRIEDIFALGNLTEAAARLVALEARHGQTQDQLAADYGTRYSGIDTDWSDILGGLQWADKLMTLVPPSDLSGAFLEHVENPQPLGYYNSAADSVHDAMQRYSSITDKLGERYNFELGPWGSWDTADFEQVKSWSVTLAEDADSANDWLAYQTAAAGLDGLVGPQVTARIRANTDDSQLVPRIVERQVLSAWLDWVYDQEPCLV